MMKLGLAVLGAALLLSVASAAQAEFTAYNDCAPANANTNQTGYVVNAVAANTTTIGMGWPSMTGQLRDFATNTLLTATVTVVNNGAVGPPSSGDGPTVKLNAGTEAGDLFNSTIDTRFGVMNYGSGAWSVDLVFTNLDPAKKYTLVTTTDRGRSDGTYPNRWSVFSIQDADAYTYASSAGAWKVSDSAVSISTYNTVNGYVAKWTDIQSGSDGDFTIHTTVASNTPGVQIPVGATVDSNKAYGPAGFMLVEQVPEPATMSLLALGGLALIRRRNVA
jgi:hypothetical protein